MKSLLFTAILSLWKRSEQVLIKFVILLQVRLTHAQTFFRGVLRRRVQKNLHAHASTCPIKTLAIDFRKRENPYLHLFNARKNVNNSKKYKMSTEVRCRIYKDSVRPLGEMYCSVQVIIHQTTIFFKAYSLSIRRDEPELDCLAVAAKIAEIMQIGP